MFTNKYSHNSLA